MVENLLRLREPAVVVLLAVSALQIVLGAVELGSRRAGSAAAAVDGRAGSGPVDLLTVVLLVVVVALCVLRSPTRHARALALASLVVSGLVVLLALVEVVVVAAARPAGGTAGWLVDLLGLLLALPVPVLALVALSRLLPARTATPTPQPIVTASPEEAPAAIEAPRPDPEHEPTWQVDQAAGVAWRTAGDAATGASATHWGTPGDAGGWQPQIGPGASGQRSTNQSSSSHDG